MDIQTFGVWLNVGSMFFSTVLLLILSIRAGTLRNSILFSLLALFTLTHGLWHLSLFLGQRNIAEYINPLSALLLVIFTVIYFRRGTAIGG